MAGTKTQTQLIAVVPLVRGADGGWSRMAGPDFNPTRH